MGTGDPERYFIIIHSNECYNKKCPRSYLNYCSAICMKRIVDNRRE